MRVFVLGLVAALAGCQPAQGIDVSPVPQLRPDSNVYYTSKYVDYSSTYNYNENWINLEKYSRIRKNLGGRFYHPAKSELSLSNDCEARLVKNVDPDFFHKHNGSYNWGEKHFMCVRQLSSLIRSEVFTYGKKSPMLARFYEEIMPNLAAQQPWLTGGFHAYSKNKNSVPASNHIRGQTFNMMHQGTFFELLGIYSWYHDYYRPTAELDQSVMTWFEKFEESMQPSILHRDFSTHGCKQDLMKRVRTGPRTGKGGIGNSGEWNPMIDSCNNVAAYNAYGYALMGAAFKNSDYTNEAIHLITNVVRAADEDGIMNDAFRCRHAVGYTQMTANALAITAAVIEASTGVWIGEMTAGNGASVNDVIQNGLETLMNPNTDRVLEDAFRGCNQYGRTDGIKKAADLRDRWQEQETNQWRRQDILRVIDNYAWYLHKTGQLDEYKSLLRDPEKYLVHDETDWYAFTVTQK